MVFSHHLHDIYEKTKKKHKTQKLIILVGNPCCKSNPSGQHGRKLPKGADSKLAIRLAAEELAH